MRFSGLVEVLACTAFYLGLALFAVRVVLPAPASTVPLPVDIPPRWQGISQSDQKLTIALIAANARALSGAFSTLWRGPQCFPLHDAITLGEHAFGDGLLGVVPYRLSGGDPILTYNTVVVLSLVLAGLAMHALVRTWTGGLGAALVAGTLFAMHPLRLGNFPHLYIGANQWTPLALLAAERVFTRRTWPWTAALVLFIGLQLLESVYSVMALALVGGTYGCWLLIRHRRALPAIAPHLVVALVAVAGAAIVVFGPYLETRAVWGTLGGRTSVLLPASSLGPGGGVWIGVVLALFAAVSIVDRFRGRRDEWAGDPRLALVVAGVVVAWAAVEAVRVPGFATPVPSLFALAARVLPVFDAVRGGSAVGSGLIVVAAVLAGFGVAALGRGRGRLAQGLVVVVVLPVGLLEIFVPRLARASFGRTVTLKASIVRPPDAMIDFYGSPQDGAVLDVPYSFALGQFSQMGQYVLLGAYHHRPIGACYNSFHVALQDEIAARSARVFDDPHAAEALAALGFRDVVAHQWSPNSKTALVLPAVTPPHLREVSRSFGTVRYALPTPARTVHGFVALASGVDRRVEAADPPVQLAAGAAAIPVRFANGSDATYRQADPIAPVPIVVRWRAASGEALREQRIRQYLPAALAAGETMLQLCDIDVPTTPGRYRMTLAPAEEPDLVIAAESVEVTR